MDSLEQEKEIILDFYNKYIIDNNLQDILSINEYTIIKYKRYYFDNLKKLGLNIILYLGNKNYTLKIYVINHLVNETYYYNYKISINDYILYEFINDKHNYRCNKRLNKYQIPSDFINNFVSPLREIIQNMM